MNNNEIKFRGKRTDNGEWVYGSPMFAEYEDVNASCIITGYEHSPTTGFVSPENRVFIDVLPESVSQFTGYHDSEKPEQP